jgi:hypothetical protein
MRHGGVNSLGLPSFVKSVAQYQIKRKNNLYKALGYKSKKYLPFLGMSATLLIFYLELLDELVKSRI